MAIPTPEPGLVVNYSYLWHHEHERGDDEGRKDRPSVIVLCSEEVAGQVVVTVLPITHAPPQGIREVIEIPAQIKRHLGLDDDRSWIVISEGNEFVWPGFDLRRRPRSDDYDFGFLPPRFFDKVRQAFVKFYREGKARTVPRD
jgi:hypothetical protein